MIKKLLLSALLSILSTLSFGAESFVRISDVKEYADSNLSVFSQDDRIFFDDLATIKAMNEAYIMAANPIGDEILVYKRPMVLAKSASSEKGAKKGSKKEAKSATSLNSVSKKDSVSLASASKDLEALDLKMQIYYPNSQKPKKPLPCVILFSGGAWNIVHPTQFALMSRMLADLGLVTAYTEYRSKQTMGKSDPTMCVEDAKSAVRYLREHAEELAIDPHMLAVCGVSAGGHIALSTACLDSYDSPDDNLEISCVPNLLILFNPVIDNSQKGYGYNRVKNIFPEISPAHNLKDSMPPSIIFVGDKDILCKPFMCVDYNKFLESKNIDSELYIYEGQKHSCFNHYVGKKYYIDSLEKTVNFLKKHNYLKQ